MATIVNTLVAEGNRACGPPGDMYLSQTTTQGPMMTTAISDLDAREVKRYSNVPLSNDLLVHDVKEIEPPRDDMQSGIPSLPQIWIKNFTMRKERRQSRRDLRAQSSQSTASRSIRIKESVAGQTSQQSNRNLSKELKPQTQVLEEQVPKSDEQQQTNTKALEVQIPIQLKDRLKTWNLSSSLQMTADENTVFESSHTDRLKDFIHFLDQNGSALCRGLPSRNLVLTLVTVTDRSRSTSSPYICIKGLMAETEIMSFHSALSQRSVRACYKPLRLCYDKALVETAASATTYQIDTSDASETLCGALLRTEIPGKGVWVSTIGGLIEVDGVYYAVTSGHQPSTAESTSHKGIPESESASSSSSMMDTLIKKGDFDIDIESALIIDTWKEEESSADLVESTTAHPIQVSKPPQHSNSFTWSDVKGATSIEGSDWRLLAVDKVHQLPNSIPYQQSSKQNSRGGQDPGPERVLFPTYLEGYTSELSKKAVYVLAGISGVCPGMLSGNISFLSIPGEKSRIVWSVKLGTGFELQKGDSGSWVVDVETNNILGYVVAISAGSAYLIPMIDLFEQILQGRSPNTSISIPSPFRLLVGLARYHFAADPSGHNTLSYYYASEAVSSEVLNRPSSDNMAILFKSAVAAGEDKSLLIRLICSVPSDVWSELGSFSTWPLNHQHSIEKDIIPVLTRIENRSRSMGQAVKVFKAPVSSVVGNEKEEKLQEKEKLTAKHETSPFTNVDSSFGKTRSKTDVAGAAKESTKATSGDEVKYLTGTKLKILILALCLSMLSTGMHSTIVATAIPKITDQFHSLSDVGWYGSVHLIAAALSQPIFAKCYTLFSIKYVYLIAIGIYGLGNLVCGTALTSIALILGRGIAGLGSGGIPLGSINIVAHSVPLVKEPIHVGVLTITHNIAVFAGLLLGGVFTDKLTWRWCFFINLPIGAITFAIVSVFFTAPENADTANLGWKARIKSFQLYCTLILVPTSIFILAIISLLMALNWGGTKYQWVSWRIIILFVFFSILIGAAVIIQFLRGDSATIPPRIIKKRSIWAATVFYFCMGSCVSSLIYFLPIWFQAVKVTSATKSGIMNLPMMLSMALAMTTGSSIITMIGYCSPFMIASSILGSIGAGLLSTLKPESGHARWIGYQCLTGIGIGLGMNQPIVAVQAVLEPSQIAVGTSLIAFVQTLGRAVFVSVGQNIFTNQLLRDMAKYAPSVDSKTILFTGITSIQHTIDKNDLPGVTLAYNNALSRVFLVASIMAAISIIGSAALEWKSIKSKKSEVSAA